MHGNFHGSSDGRRSAGIRSALTTASFALALGMSLAAGTSAAAGFGMVTDNASGELRLFDAGTGKLIDRLQGSPGQISGDCALSVDESTGYTSNAGRNISVFSFADAAPGKSADITSIAISNAGVDLSLSPDGRFLVSAGAGLIDEPLSIIDTVKRVELATSTPFLDHTSAEFCDDGTLLLTTTFGNSFATPFDNAIYDARVSAAGEVEMGGSRLSSGAQPNNSSCAPGSGAGVLLDREAGLTSFTLPGLEKADFAKLHGGTAVAAVFSRAGDRLYVRTTNTVEAFGFDPVSGAMTADWVQPLSFSAEYFGIDQIAINPASGGLFVDGGRELLILDPASGAQTGSVNSGDATGVCFAQQQPRAPVFVAAIGAP